MTNIATYYGDVLNQYSSWKSPTVIVSDGAYGVGGFPTDSNSPKELHDWYEPHIRQWSKHCSSETTLWFWNTERGWAEVHPLLEEYGWEYRGANIWNKGIQHVAGNTNTNTIRKFPQVTEMCVQYVRSNEAILGLEDDERDVQQWMRDEWKRAGLTYQEANDACGVASAATRKYFASDDMWYFPPPEKFQQLRKYANMYGKPDGRPYLSTEKLPFELEELNEVGHSIHHRSKFNCSAGLTNVWNHPPLHGDERIELPSGVSHPNQKPKELIERIVTVSSDVDDVVWEPFGGLGTATIVSANTERHGCYAEIEKEYYEAALDRFNQSVTGSSVELVTAD